MFLVENKINLLWFGSALREQHKQRLINWRLLNPKHAVTLWIHRGMLDDSTFSSIDQFCRTNQIHLLPIESIHSLIASKTLAWLNRLVAMPVRNYGAITDIYRFYVMKAQNGGWYFDTDIVPLLPLPVDLLLPFGFAIQTTYDSNGVDTCAPSIMVASINSPFLQVAINIIDQFVQQVAPFSTPYLHRNDALDKMLATHLSTGAIARSTCSKLYINFHPFFHSYDSRDGQIDDFAMYQQISLNGLNLARLFDITGEISWLLDENRTLLPELYNAVGVSRFMVAEHKRFPAFCSYLSLLFEQALVAIPPTHIKTPTPLLIKDSEETKEVLPNPNQFFAGAHATDRSTLTDINGQMTTLCISSSNST